MSHSDPFSPVALSHVESVLHCNMSQVHLTQRISSPGEVSALYRADPDRCCFRSLAYVQSRYGAVHTHQLH